MAEERAIQARQGYAQEEVMDATARLLSPSATSKRQGATGQPTSDVGRGASPRRPSPKQNASSTGKPARQKQPKPSAGAGQQAGPKAASKPSPEAGAKGQKTSSKPAPSKPARANKSRSSRPSRRGPMEVTLRLGSQKDSTEQSSSLMKPYYFNPDED